MRVVWRAFWGSRALVWLAGLAALALFGVAPHSSLHLDPLGLTEPFGSHALDTLLAPALRWDAAHYLRIAAYGYTSGPETAFFPLYPLLMASGGPGVGSLAFGLGLSLGAALGGLLLLHRLVRIDFGPRVAAATISIVAWFPGSLALSGVYTESLFLLLSVGSVYFARSGGWARAGMLGALAAATRSAGILLVVPLLLVYGWGPRADREEGSPDAVARRSGRRYRLDRSVLWIALVPLGLIAYSLYLNHIRGEPLGFVGAQGGWDRVVAPLAGIPMAAWKALQGLTGFLPGVGPDSPLAPSGPLVGLRNTALLGFLLLALWLLRESWRRLPAAYTAYAAVALALPLSAPAADEPLESLPRFMVVIFPLWIALALWALERERSRMRWILGGFAVLLAGFAGLFTTWAQAP